MLGLFLPVYSDGESGFDVIWGATGGYIIGFVIAAGAIGWAAEHGRDRKVLTAFITFCAGQLIIFGIGVPWLKVAVDMTWATRSTTASRSSSSAGSSKAAAAGLLTPTAWHFVRRVDKR